MPFCTTLFCILMIVVEFWNWFIKSLAKWELCRIFQSPRSSRRLLLRGIARQSTFLIQALGWCPRSLDCRVLVPSEEGNPLLQRYRLLPCNARIGCHVNQQVPFHHCPSEEKFKSKCWCKPTDNFDWKGYSCTSKWFEINNMEKPKGWEKQRD